MQLVYLFALFSVCTALSNPSRFGIGAHRMATQLMIDVAAHQYECYFQHFPEGTVVQIFGKLIDRSETWMILQFTSPTDVLNEYKKTRDQVEYKVTVPETGDYKICATSNSPYGVTRIILQIFAYHPDELNQAIQEQQDHVVLHAGMKNNTNNLFQHTWDAYYHLKYSNLQVIHDTYAQEKNRQYIDQFSFFQCGVILSCAFIQVVVIRKFFGIRDGKRPYA